MTQTSETTEIKATPAIAARISVAPYRERFTTCASCRSAAVGMVMIDGRPGSTVCRRHIDVWVRRAVERLTREGA